MTATGRLIPRSRLRGIPRHLRLAHEYSFFVHDENVRLLKEYEGARAHFVSVKFKRKRDATAFHRLRTEGVDGLQLLKSMNYPNELRRVILNQVTMALASDCLHHLYEALRCLEKRKMVVAFNLLRKPLLDNLTYLSWMVGDEDDFYASFTSGNVEALTNRKVGNKRLKILEKAIAAVELGDVLDASLLHEALFSVKNPSGLYGLFQHAVHLVTFERMELQTAPENFNFVFKSHADDDLYELLYGFLPVLLLYLSTVTLELFDRIKPMDGAAKRAFRSRSRFGFYLTEGDHPAEIVTQTLGEILLGHATCDRCAHPVVVTRHNAARILLTDSFRCTACHCNNPFPFSWVF